jgi:multisubunit Na+/H+ antiporter MnhB subunit
MVAVVLDSTRQEQFLKHDSRSLVNAGISLLVIAVIFYTIYLVSGQLAPLGEGKLRMAEHYITGAAEKTGSINLVTGVVFDFRGYDTLGEATVLVTAVLGILTILRIRGKKENFSSK